MNWKLIFFLSLLGPVLALLGNYGIISFTSEPYVALGILVLIAVAIGLLAKGRHFLYGLFTVLLFGILMSFVRLAMLNDYVNHNTGVMEHVEDFLHKVKIIRSPMIILGSMIAMAGIATGILSMFFGWLFRPRRKKTKK